MASVSDLVSEIDVEGFVFSPLAKPHGSNSNLFLAGAGVRGVYIEGDFVKFSAIGVYLEGNAVDVLAMKWKGKTEEELVASNEFFRDISTGPFEKFTRVTFIRLLNGIQYSDKVSDNCEAIWKSSGIYTDKEAQAIQSFKDIFKNHTFPPSSSVLFTQSVGENFTIGFASEGRLEADIKSEVVENKLLGEAILDSIIGENGVSPATRRSIASRLVQLFSTGNIEKGRPSVEPVMVEEHEEKKISLDEQVISA